MKDYRYSGLLRVSGPVIFALIALSARDYRAYIIPVALWACLTNVRASRADPTALQDLFICVCVNAFLWKRIWWDWAVGKWWDPGLLSKQTAPSVSAILVGTVIAVGVAILLSLLGGFKKPDEKFDEPTTEDGTNGGGNGHRAALKPLLFPCRTTHSRMFPKRYSFGYSYLLVGIPIPWDGRRGGLLSAEVESRSEKRWRNGWLQVGAEDYLERGGAELGLAGKLKEYLRGQGVADNDWHLAYLVTAPRFWGYSFNPVSFWYIYDYDQELKMMILEVNNTFDERRMYLLQANHDDDNTSESELPESARHRYCRGATKKKFTNAWLKDFHVSPFNSRKGSYTLKAVNPFNHNNSKVEIDNTITLQSSKDHPKIVARVFSSHLPLDPTNLTAWESFRFLAGWWWVGLVTFPRILREAAKLFFVRKLQVWFRPEVSLNSIGRNATKTEIVLESFFEKYLASLVKSGAAPLHVIYRPAVGATTTKEYKSPSVSSTPSPPKKLEIRVLTPAFYSRFIHYAHTSEAFDRECLCTDQKNRTLWISNPEILPALIPKISGAPGINPSNGFDQLRWALLRKLRCPPAAPAYPTTPATAQKPNTSIKDIRFLPLSNLDKFVQSLCNDAWMYRRNAIKVFLAQRFAFGLTEIIVLADILFRTFLILGTQPHLSHWNAKSEKSKIFFSTEMEGYLDMLVRVSAVHFWAFVKGWG